MTSFKVTRLLTNFSGAGTTIHPFIRIIPPHDGRLTLTIHVSGTLNPGTNNLEIRGAPDDNFLVFQPAGVLLGRIRLNVDLDQTLRVGLVECIPMPIILLRNVGLGASEVVNAWLEE